MYTVYRFKQSPWLLKYIKYKMEQRSKTKNDFDNYFYKLILFTEKRQKNLKRTFKPRFDRSIRYP